MTFRVISFWTEYKTHGIDADGKPVLKGVDMVSYCPIGKANSHVCVEAVSRLGKLIPLEGKEDNEAVKMAHARWAVIKPAYDAWKNNQDIPSDGTPLGAWAGVTSSQGDGLRMMGIKTVEDLAALSDGIVSKIPFPGARELQKSAQMYLAASDRNKVTAELTDLHAKLKERDDQLEEMRQMILEMQAARDEEEGEAAPKRRGRPKREEAAAA